MQKVLWLGLLGLLVGCGDVERVPVVEPTPIVEPTPEVTQLVVIGAVDCRGLDDEGGLVKISGKIGYQEAILRDSFTVTYAIDGSIVDFQTPIVYRTADNSAYLIESQFYVDSDEEKRYHQFELSYMLSSGVSVVYRGGCKQGGFEPLTNN